MNVLLVTWDGGGNLPPMLGIGSALIARGHTVRCLGPAGIDRAVAREGIGFLPLNQGERFDPLVRMGQAAVRESQGRVFLGDGYASDLREACAHLRPDLIVIDCFLVAAQAEAERLGLRFVLLAHTLPGWILPFWDSVLLAPSNGVRARAGLKDVASTAELWGRAAAVLAATWRDLDGPLPPGAPVITYTGPIFETDPAGAAAAPPMSSTRPRVLVSFSTTFVDQAARLSAVIGALARLEVDALVTTGPAIDPATLPHADNVALHRWLPHSAVLAQVGLVISHGGHSTVTRTLAAGVPLLCLPQGNDQDYVAERVQAMGAGRTLDPDSDPTALAASIAALLGQPSFRAAARQIAAAGRHGGDGRDTAATALEGLDRSGAAMPGIS